MIAYRCGHSPSQSGYVLVEMLIAAAIGILLVGVLLQFAVSAQTSTAVQGDIADLQQRLRVAMESMRHDLMLAGAGPARGAARGPLVRVLRQSCPRERVSLAPIPNCPFIPTASA